MISQIRARSRESAKCPVQIVMRCDTHSPTRDIVIHMVDENINDNNSHLQVVLQPIGIRRDMRRAGGSRRVDRRRMPSAGRSGERMDRVYCFTALMDGPGL